MMIKIKTAEGVVGVDNYNVAKVEPAGDGCCRVYIHEGKDPDGRPKPHSVIECTETSDAIIDLINTPAPPAREPDPTMMMLMGLAEKFLTKQSEPPVAAPTDEDAKTHTAPCPHCGGDHPLRLCANG